MPLLEPSCLLARIVRMNFIVSGSIVNADSTLLKESGEYHQITNYLLMFNHPHPSIASCFCFQQRFCLDLSERTVFTHCFVMIMEQNTASASGELELLVISDYLLSLSGRQNLALIFLFSFVVGQRKYMCELVGCYRLKMEINNRMIWLLSVSIKQSLNRIDRELTHLFS